jgi:hypothetical protein
LPLLHAISFFRSGSGVPVSGLGFSFLASNTLTFLGVHGDINRTRYVPKK